MKTVGITGPPGSGKTALWRAMTGGAAGEVGTLEVPDPRLSRLTEVQGTPKQVAVKIEVVDVHASAHTPSETAGRLREMDALLIVVPAFGGREPGTALSEVLGGLILWDMGPIQSRLGTARKEAGATQEVAVLESALETLGAGKMLRGPGRTQEEMRLLSGLAPLTLKPLFVAFNVEEGATATPETDLPSLSIAAGLEAEVAGMDEADARELLAAYGVEDTAVDKLVAAIYGTFDLVTFYTTTEGETRAWEVLRGTKAPQAAGAIHTDMERGFIRAEVAPIDDVVAAGGWKEAKAAGHIRVEGKDYEISDGDVMLVRFSV